MAGRATDSISQMDPGANDPIGTKAEVKKLGLPLVKYSTCSLPGKANRGCPFFDHFELGPCPIRKLLAERGRPGPEMVAYVAMKSPTNWKQDATHCYSYMQHLHTQDPRLSLNKVIGIGGDKVIRRRTTEPVDKSNPRGGRSRTVFVNEPIERLLRPDVTMAERVEAIAMADEIRSDRRGRMPDLPNGLDDVDDTGVELDEDDLAMEALEDDGAPEGGPVEKLAPEEVEGDGSDELDD